ncbi:MAG: hypothetical protein ABIY37_08170 [Devosia sp.]
MGFRHQIASAISEGNRQGRISRRNALQLALSAGLLGIAGRSLIATPVAAQEVPTVGPQPDGTTLWKVQVGAMDMQYGIDFQAFFPDDISIHVGDKIWFQFAPMGMPAFHTVTFTSGEKLPDIFAPDIVDGKPVPSPEGPPRLMINPQVAFPDGRSEYDGTGYTNSGLDILRMDQGPYILAFTKAGTFEYQCLAHGVVMKGTVTVLDAGAALPTEAAGYEAKVQDEIAKLTMEGRAAIESAKPTSTVSDSGTIWEVAAGLGGTSQARVMRFSPQTVTIKVGDTVRWTDQTIGEPHTITFLGGTEPPEDTLIEAQPSGPPKLIQSFQTFMPVGEATFDGNGYRNSGFLGLPPEIGDMFGLKGNSYELKFTKAGSFPYYCILHSGGPDDKNGMIGVVVVEG